MTKRLFLLSPSVVFTARVNQVGRTYPVTEVPFDAGVAIGTVVEGMTVVFGTSDGAADLGRQRVRAGSTLGATGTLNIGRSSIGNRDGEINIADDAYIQVWDDFRPWAKIPLIEIDGTIYKDSDIAVGTKTSNIPPKANIEPASGAAGDIAPGTNVMTVSFSGTGSYANSGTISSYLWDVDDGTITVGTSASSAITATFPAGFRWVSLTVTDSNANTHIMRVPVYARDPASDTSISNFQITSHRITAMGQEVSLRILEDIDEGTYPDGTLVMLWDSDLTTITDGSHMTFVGWHHTDPAEIEAGRTALLSEVTLDCLDIAGKLKTLPGFPISVEGNASPSTWLEMSNPNMDKYVDYILRWHSTALELAYFTPSGTGSDYPFVILSSDGQALWEQAARRCQSLVPDYVLTCDRNGRIAMKPDPMITPLGSRTATVQTTIDESEWSSINYTRQRAPRVHWLRSEAVLASATEIGALFSVAPDDTPGQGVSNQTQGEQLAINQTDLNAAEGNRYARLNAFESPFRIELTSGAIPDIEPADMTWVQLTMSAATAALRGLAFTNERGLVQEIAVSYRYNRSGLEKTVSLTWERETDGPPAKAYIPPVIDPDIPYDPPPPETGFDPPVGEGTGFGTVYVMTGDTLGRTRAFSASSPAYSDISPVTAASFMSFVLDPWQPATTGFLITATDGIYRSQDLDQTVPTWSQVLSISDITTALSGISATGIGVLNYFEGSVNFDGHFIFIVWVERVGDKPLYCIRTTDRGATWNYYEIHSDVGSFEGSAGIVQRVVSNNMRIFATFGSPVGASLRARSDNGGQTWAIVNVLNDMEGGKNMSMHIPYNDNPTGQIFYVCNLRGVNKTTDGGVTMAIVAGNQDKHLVHRWSAESYTQDRNRMYRIDTEANPDALYLSDDGFATDYAAGMSGMSDSSIFATGGFPYNAGQFYLLSNSGIYVSTDRCDTWANKTGDWAFGFTFWTGSGDYPRKGTIVPLWTE